MTQQKRNRLSTAAWAASFICSGLLLASAIAAAAHQKRHDQDPPRQRHEISTPYTVTVTQP